MDRDEVLSTLRDHEQALRLRGVAHAALFGSTARGDATPTSDIDIMLEIEQGAPVGVFEYVGITQYLADLFPNRVDVANRDSLKAVVRPSAERDAIMPSDPARLALHDIQEHINLARDFVAGMDRETFAADRRTVYATTRCLEIISEAARRLSQAMRDRHPHLPWRAIMGAGNVYRHDYDNVVDAFIWRTVQDSLPSLLEAVESLVGLGNWAAEFRKMLKLQQRPRPR